MKIRLFSLVALMIVGSPLVFGGVLFSDNFNTGGTAGANSRGWEFIQNDNKRKNIIGLFGDSMQSIYEKGVGNIRKYIEAEQGVVKEVIKPDNYRCSEAVINLLNARFA